MPYLLDSDWVIDRLEGVPAAVSLLNRLAEEGIAISIVTYMEVFEGVLTSPDPEEAGREFDVFILEVPVIPFSQEVAHRCARLRETLRRQRQRVNQRALDLIIAATALEYDLTLVTRNLDDYRDIPNLKLWQAT